MGQFDAGACRNISKDFTRRFGDLRYSAQFKVGAAELDVCIILEHQSRPDSFMSFRLMGYIYSAYQQRLSALRQGMRFPYPLAVVLHHGKTPWKKIAPMRDLITMPPRLEGDFFNVPIHLIDFAVIHVEELRGHPKVCMLLDILQSGSAGILPERFQQILARLRDISRKEDVVPLFEALLCQILRGSPWRSRLTSYAATRRYALSWIAFRRSNMRFAVWRCFLWMCLSASRMPFTHSMCGPSFGAEREGWTGDTWGDWN